MMTRSKNKTILVIAFVLLLLVGFIVLSVLITTKPATVDTPNVPPAGEITIQGSIVCLPKIDLSGPQTLECAYGLLDNQARYFALRDTDPTYQNLVGAPRDRLVEVTGIFTPTPSGEYRDIGFIEVSNIK